MPVGVWSCVEWQFDGGANTMRLWLDGQPIDSLTVPGLGQRPVGGVQLCRLAGDHCLCVEESGFGGARLDGDAGVSTRA